MHLSRLFQRSVDMYADCPALAQGTGPAASYRELDRQVRALAQHLRHELGLAPGDRVCLAMQNCVEYAQAMLAIWHARLCAVPVNSKLHPKEVGYILQDSGAKVCLTQAAFLDALQASASTGATFMTVDGASWRAARSANPAPADMPVGGDDELAWLFYTSGTTGRPKGVMLSHANLVQMALNFQTDMQSIDSSDVLIHVAPLSHGAGLYAIPYWMQGALQVVSASGGFDEAELASLLGHYSRASLFAAPTIVTRLVGHLQKTGTAVPGLRCLLVGGAPFYAQDIKAAVNCLGPRLAQLYGQGESPMTISALRADRLARAVADNDTELLGSVGYPQSTVDVAILDPEGQPAAPGGIGEIVVFSPTVMQGYWGNTQATEATLQNGGLRTGDMGLIDSRGLLHIKDRSKDVIISGGTNIYPREVEDALLCHPDVLEASVIGTPDPDWGESVTAFIVSRAPVDAAQLDAHCREHIARFKRPKHYVFLETLPKNPTGKVLKGELRSLAKAG
ncbi:AMP-binding protein [Bordetella petrii]|uniref:AMP-binding protein n=1 Tax=Bordetella petrii TaxID=94624 RepID=UPI001E2C9187|nr:AMP-binding protein [Bordetella petrii]MCD0501754.1 AMP-binding protein [Bordetella petrii]